MEKEHITFKVSSLDPIEWLDFKKDCEGANPECL